MMEIVLLIVLLFDAFILGAINGHDYTKDKYKK